MDIFKKPVITEEIYEGLTLSTADGQIYKSVCPDSGAIKYIGLMSKSCFRIFDFDRCLLHATLVASEADTFIEFNEKPIKVDFEGKWGYDVKIYGSINEDGSISTPTALECTRATIDQGYFF